MDGSSDERHPLTRAVFWALVAFLLAYAGAGALVIAGAGPTAVGRIVAVLEALVLLAIGGMFAVALARPDLLNRLLSDGERRSGAGPSPTRRPKK
jgi:hypothetical protein